MVKCVVRVRVYKQLNDSPEKGMMNSSDCVCLQILVNEYIYFGSYPHLFLGILFLYGKENVHIFF